MAKRRNIKKGKVKKDNQKSVIKFPFTKKNYLIIGVGLAVIIIGFLLMATGITNEPAVPDGKWNNPLAVTIAPIILLIGYVVIIPYGILKFFGNKEQKDSE